MLKCNQCGVNNQPGSKFCGGCGNNLAVQPQASAPQPSASPPVKPGYAPPPQPAQSGRPMPPPPPGTQGGYPPQPGYAPPPSPAQTGRPMPPPPPGMQGGYAPPPGSPYGYAQSGYSQTGYQQPSQHPYGDPFEKTAQLGWKRKNAAIVCYLVGWLSGLIMFFMEKDHFVRFHAAQSVAVFGGIMILTTILPMALPRGIYNAIAPLMNILSLVSTGLWVFLMYKASKGEYYKLPAVGDMAEKFVRDNSQ